MVVISKLIEELRYHNCDEIFHSGPCMKRAYSNIFYFLLSNCKYFAPTIFLPLFVKLKDINKNLLLDALKYYLSATGAGTTTGWTISVFMCLFRQQLGQFKPYTFIFLPSIIGALTLYMWSERTFRLFKITVFQMFIEVALTKRKNVLTKAISTSKTLQTLIFMCCSAIIMEAKRIHIYKGFWILQPAASKQLETENDPDPIDYEKCKHDGLNCKEHLMQGLRSYVAIGLTLDLIKSMMSSVPKPITGFLPILLAKFKQFRLSTTGLLALYMGIYRLTHCLLNNQSFRMPLLSNHILSSFLSGLCYSFNSRKTFLAYAIAISLEIIWLYWRQHKSNNESKSMTFLKKLPLDKILYPLSLAHVIHVYALRPNYVTNLCRAVIDGVANNYGKNISEYTTALERQMEQRM